MSTCTERYQKKFGSILIVDRKVWSLKLITAVNCPTEDVVSSHPCLGDENNVCSVLTQYSQLVDTLARFCAALSPFMWLVHKNPYTNYGSIDFALQYYIFYLLKVAFLVSFSQLNIIVLYTLVVLLKMKMREHVQYFIYLYAIKFMCSLYMAAIKSADKYY